MENADILQVAADILSEFLEVAIHNILFVCNVYPPEAFERRRKYNVPVQMSLHPAVCAYITNSITTIHKLLKKNEIEKIVISILNCKEKPLKHFVFDIDIPSDKELQKDFSLIDVEMALRALCLKINISDGILESNSDENTFRIFIHTKQMTAISLAVSDDNSAQEFPWIEAEFEQSDVENGVIVPIKTADTEIAKMQFYVVEKE
ncbi:mitotic spindle assembly checkpoint protein MAD2B-like [Centruroides vittatus]|uniref:mitotic spindle assembly checkpoint protein MAD2B-like n=1 Tax=Centruroides vittatus TaxID=120091 RepID=UPI003510ACC1